MDIKTLKCAGLRSANEAGCAEAPASIGGDQL